MYLHTGANPESHLHITHLHISYLCKYVKDKLNFTQNTFAQIFSREFLMILSILVFLRDHMERDIREIDRDRSHLFHHSLKSTYYFLCHCSEVMRILFWDDVMRMFGGVV